MRAGSLPLALVALSRLTSLRPMVCGSKTTFPESAQNEGYVEGVSTRRVDDLKALGCALTLRTPLRGLRQVSERKGPPVA
jgi:hypothetical protein